MDQVSQTTSEKVAAVEAYLTMGLSLKKACDRVGLHRQTYYSFIASKRKAQRQSQLEEGAA